MNRYYSDSGKRDFLKRRMAVFIVSCLLSSAVFSSDDLILNVKGAEAEAVTEEAATEAALDDTVRDAAETEATADETGDVKAAPDSEENKAGADEKSAEASTDEKGTEADTGSEAPPEEKNTEASPAEKGTEASPDEKSTEVPSEAKESADTGAEADERQQDHGNISEEDSVSGGSAAGEESDDDPYEAVEEVSRNAMEESEDVSEELAIEVSENDAGDNAGEEKREVLSDNGIELSEEEKEKKKEELGVVEVKLPTNFDIPIYNVGDGLEVRSEDIELINESSFPVDIYITSVSVNLTEVSDGLMQAKLMTDGDHTYDLDEMREISDLALNLHQYGGQDSIHLLDGGYSENITVFTLEGKGGAVSEDSSLSENDMEDESSEETIVEEPEGPEDAVEETTEEIREADPEDPQEEAPGNNIVSGEGMKENTEADSEESGKDNGSEEVIRETYMASPEENGEDEEKLLSRSEPEEEAISDNETGQTGDREYRNVDPETGKRTVIGEDYEEEETEDDHDIEREERGPSDPNRAKINLSGSLLKGYNTGGMHCKIEMDVTFEFVKHKEDINNGTGTTELAE